MDVVTRLEGEGKAGSYIASNLKAAKSWLAHNGIEVRGRIRVKGAQDTPTLRDKRTLTNSDLALLFSSAPPQTRCAAALVAGAGLRLESVGNYEGTDGLRIGDLPEMTVTDCGGDASCALALPTVFLARKNQISFCQAFLSNARHSARSLGFDILFNSQDHRRAQNIL